jgi:tetratricopeptide (TPR) repeat protein
MKRIYITLLLFVASMAIYAQEEIVTTNSLEITKTQADSAYINNDFASAIEMYEQILKDNGESSDIYYNLGNSYYKIDHIAKAILNYEKALLLNPGDGDIRFNLEMAQSKTVDKVVPISEMFFVTWIKSLINTSSEKGWSKVGIISFIIMLVAITMYLFSKRIVWKKVGFITALFMLFICVLANVFASTQKTEIQKHESAIIMAPSVTVKSTPNEGGTDLFIIHEGRKVTIKDNTMKDWKEIQLEDGNAGWVPTSVIEVI